MSPTTARVAISDRDLEVAFEPEEEPGLAGGPVYVEVTISLVDGEPVTVLSGASRSTSRNDDYTFTAAAPGDVTLRDPFADAVELGGVEFPRELTAGTPLTERVLLNQFLTLEDLVGAQPDGRTTPLTVRAVRRIRQPASGEPTDAPVELQIPLRHDDDALARWYRDVADTVRAARDGDAVREQRLTELLTARNHLATDALETLTGHPDPGVAQRVALALSALG